VAGASAFAAAGPEATEWSGGSVVNLGHLPGSIYSLAEAINNAGQVVGYSLSPSISYATEWSGGGVINLGGLPGSTFNQTLTINDAGQSAGESSIPITPEPSSSAMLLLGFAGLGFVGYRRARAGRATLAA
jgi:probable HAF family extracellular repeat protein